MDTATIIGCATFLIGAILTCLGLLVITVTALLANNWIVKYWKPIKFFHYVTDPVPLDERRSSHDNLGH